MGSPIGLQAVRRSVQPSQSELALSQFMSMSLCMPGKNNETEPKRMDQTDVACFASSGTVGIVDLGASRTVVGSQVKEILTGVPESIRTKIRRTQNHQTLSTQHALLFPFGDMWFEVAIIEGNTPFLLSASFLKRIGVIIDIEKNTLWSGVLQRYLQIGMSPRNLMMLDINEFWSSKKKIQAGLINDAEFQESLLNQEYIQSPRIFFFPRVWPMSH